MQLLKLTLKGIDTSYSNGKVSINIRLFSTSRWRSQQVVTFKLTCNHAKRFAMEKQVQYHWNKLIKVGVGKK
ncbi:CLUMA_CG016089, isoform A [Clunio marinus]|uniref:CLUMA_CG016089, isoform A n=1 Tax=Clunio marinus TaxID=568069 RepID=A0A1J1IR60_9DIPT|nr:CLUMA_CG016089, isoform A [Clunio marinus]